LKIKSKLFFIRYPRRGPGCDINKFIISSKDTCDVKTVEKLTL